MRVVAILSIALAAALANAGLAEARPAVKCQTVYPLNGRQLILIGTNVNCATARAIVRGLVRAPVIARIEVNGVRLLKLRSPRSGWTCATSTPIRTKGAGCQKGTMRVIYVDPAG